MRYLPDVYVDKLVSFLAERIDHAPHLQFYIRWCRELLCVHGDRLKERSSEIVASLRDLQKSILQKQVDIGLLYVTRYDHDPIVRKCGLGSAGLPKSCTVVLWLSLIKLDSVSWWFRSNAMLLCSSDV